MDSNKDYSQEAFLIKRCQRELADGKEKDPVDKLRLQCLTRGMTGILGFGRVFRNKNHHGAKALNMEEFGKGIHEAGVDCDDGEIKALFNRFKQSGDGSINMTDFLMKLRPPMPKCRQDILEEAFNKIEGSEGGVITIADLKRNYCVRHDTQYKSGDLTEAEILSKFLTNFEGGVTNNGKVTKDDFLDYYAVISSCIDSNIYFDLVIRRSFKF